MALAKSNVPGEEVLLGAFGTFDLVRPDFEYQVRQKVGIVVGTLNLILDQFSLRQATVMDPD